LSGKVKTQGKQIVAKQCSNGTDCRTFYGSNCYTKDLAQSRIDYKVLTGFMRLSKLASSYVNDLYKLKNLTGYTGYKMRCRNQVTF